MALALERRAMKDDILAGDTPKAKRRAHRLKSIGTKTLLTKHSKLADLDGYLGPDALKRFFIFMLVRNPWDRLASYYHWLRDQRFQHPAVEIAQSADFAQFIQHPFNRQSIQAAPYGRYVTDVQGTERCNLFVRLENLAQDLAPLEHHLGLRLDTVPHVNRSSREPDYRTYYSDALAEQVATLCKEDILRFGYAF